MKSSNQMSPIDDLVRAADMLEAYLVESSRQDDPHRFRLATLPSEWDDGKVARSIVIDLLAGTKRRIALRLAGSIEGQEKVVELAAIVVDVPAAPTAH